MTKVFVPSADHRFAAHLRTVCTSIGAEVVYTPSEYVVAFSDPGALQAPWVCATDLRVATSRMSQQQFQFAVPSVKADSGDMSAVAAGRVFVKPNSTLTDRNANALCYTSHDSLETALIEIRRLRPSQADKLVIQPHLDDALDVLGVNFSVNTSGDVYAFSAYMAYAWSGVYGIDTCVMVQPPADAVALVRTLVSTYGVVGGLHEVQLVLRNDQWLLMDWNPRLSITYDDGFMDVDGVLDSAVRHLIGLDFVPVVGPYIQRRLYRSRTVTEAQVQIAKDMGFRVRLHHRAMPNKGLDALAWVGDQDTADNMFAQFDSLL